MCEFIKPSKIMEEQIGHFCVCPRPELPGVVAFVAVAFRLSPLVAAAAAFFEAASLSAAACWAAARAAAAASASGVGSILAGLLGGRIDLIPHQLYIAKEVANRYAPRVLLADEVGLGKTIEACLILHRLILTGRAQRVLIILPESLLHQWFIELLRRFNMWFTMVDTEMEVAGSNRFL